MSTKIGGLDNSPIQVGKGGGVKRNAGTPDGAQSAKTQPSDTQITESARQLAALEQTVRDLPAIDQSRVDQASQRIQNGSYQVDSAKVADKLLHSDRELNKDT